MRNFTDEAGALMPWSRRVNAELQTGPESGLSEGNHRESAHLISLGILARFFNWGL